MTGFEDEMQEPEGWLEVVFRRLTDVTSFLRALMKPCVVDTLAARARRVTELLRTEDQSLCLGTRRVLRVLCVGT